MGQCNCCSQLIGKTLTWYYNGIKESGEIQAVSFCHPEHKDTPEFYFLVLMSDESFKTISSSSLYNKGIQNVKLKK
jgi:hypothetical protein